MNTNGKFLVVTGRPGIYEIKGQSKSGLLVRHLENGKMLLASPMTVSLLDDIVIYTEDDKVSLPEVLWRMKEKAGEIPPANAPKDELSRFFEEIIPAYDKDKFYPSHMKKIIQWFRILDRVGRWDELKTGEEGTEKEND